MVGRAGVQRKQGKGMMRSRTSQERRLSCIATFAGPRRMLLLCLGSALLFACGARETSHALAGENGNPPQHMNGHAADESTASGQRADEHSVFQDIPDGRLKAEAWPETSMDRPWARLDDGEGAFISADGSGPWTFLFSSRESSLPARGLRIDLPAELTEEQLPRFIEVWASPTPIQVTREAWPVIAPLMRFVGQVELHPEANGTLFIEFPSVERVSLLEVRVLSATSGRQIGLGRVSLVHQRATVSGAQVRRSKLRPASDVPVAPESSGILGIEGASPLPIPSNL